MVPILDFNKTFEGYFGTSDKLCQPSRFPLPTPHELLTFAPCSDGGRAGRLELASGVGPGGGSDTAWTFSKPGIDAI